jgi:hypothetical protein
MVVAQLAKENTAFYSCNYIRNQISGFQMIHFYGVSTVIYIAFIFKHDIAIFFSGAVENGCF